MKKLYFRGIDWSSPISLGSGTSYPHQEFSSLPEAEAWLLENELHSINAFWFCEDCESPDGGALCDACQERAGQTLDTLGATSVKE